jgi:hypothetical protein
MNFFFLVKFGSEVSQGEFQELLFQIFGTVCAEAELLDEIQTKVFTIYPSLLFTVTSTALH